MTDRVVHEIDGVSFMLKEKHAFDWLTPLGTVFCVFDQQDSGNISFGLVQEDGQKQFVKYAGARTLQANDMADPEEAIRHLQSSVLIYEDLAHDSLIRLIDHFATDNGYACMFDLVEGECLHSHWSFPPPAKYEDPRSPYVQFRQLPVQTRIQAMERILDFHIEAERKGYVAVDFYDGSLIYDFAADEIHICDIDLYRAGTFTNTMGRMWGSSRFMSPEEFELGASIDAVTNVFNMGAMAFALLGGELDRSQKRWDAGEALYEVALRAVNPDRFQRFTSVADLGLAWKEVMYK
ncbi:protein kinase family protein [Paenibacillus cucumis (ex Kampfer et al. 2016)]|uniref:Serine/threonine protein kinase n=1 Tax=Paenibacillus cucumis (ex Kampfer et al. 2016) TaxID=1776858 RepID=A0ABS7KDQ0_9BACL|nr:serine/threonine protein kinase [Paenibacillus cucumis (ex Kampfer et al. 2016)]MBY0202260.1 serine/threonine protein kinase [Paenibacillus cucumis (ex Kampfer et al. 2016)]